MSKLQLTALSIDVTGLSLSTGWDYPHLLQGKSPGYFYSKTEPKITYAHYLTRSTKLCKSYVVSCIHVSIVHSN